MTDHLADVRRYDATARAETVERIVKHLGVALRNRRAARVSCEDREELDRVREKWCRKKLGESDDSRCGIAIRLVCETMANDAEKSRVTFYYLVAKQLGKLATL